MKSKMKYGTKNSYPFDLWYRPPNSGFERGVIEVVVIHAHFLFNVVIHAHFLFNTDYREMSFHKWKLYSSELIFDRALQKSFPQKTRW
jgi:hypothetical protein